MSGLESTARIIMSWAGSGMTRLSVTSFRRLAVVDSLCWVVWLSVIMSGHVPSHYTRPLLAKHLDFRLISPVTGEITECLDQSDDPRGLLAHQLNKRKPKRPKVLHYKCYGWMEVLQVKLKMSLDYDSAMFISLKCSVHTKHNNNLKFVVFGIYNCHLYPWEYLHSD